jgi:hypothetical protein
MRKLAPVLAMLALASAATPAWGQEQEELSLAIRRDFGFRSGDRIQGRFTLEAVGPTSSGLEDEEQRLRRSIEDSKYLE